MVNGIEEKVDSERDACDEGDGERVVVLVLVGYEKRNNR